MSDGMQKLEQSKSPREAAPGLYSSSFDLAAVHLPNPAIDDPVVKPAVLSYSHSIVAQLTHDACTQAGWHPWWSLDMCTPGSRLRNSSQLGADPPGVEQTSCNQSGSLDDGEVSSNSSRGQ